MNDSANFGGTDPIGVVLFAGEAGAAF